MNCRNYVLKPLLAGLFVLFLATSANAATINVPADYTTIQAAVNAAAIGDTILVQSGTYYENVNVNKRLTLQGNDTGSGLPVVDAGGSGDAITLSANNCTLQDFVAMNSSSSSYGIRVTSSYNTVSGNTATGNSYAGILLSSSSGNTLSGNTATCNTNFGILLYPSSNGNTLSGNTATGNIVGIYLYSSSNGNTISSNTATGNIFGIYLSSSSDNTLSGNTATSNTIYGIVLSSTSNGNTIFLNTFDNTNNAWSNLANYWNATTPQTGHNLTGLLGNIWSDYNGFDCDGDGMGDTPYLIAGGSDRDYHPIGGVPCSKKLLCISGYKLDGCTGLPLSGWRIKVNNSTQEWNATTDGNGFWRVCNLENDTYTIREVPQSSWAQTYPAGFHSQTLAGVNITNINFTNQKMYCISGYKKDNSTGSPLPGWNITLQNATHTVSQLTGLDGKYEFCNLKPGDYTITEEARSGYTAVSVVANPVTLNCSNITNQNFTNTLLPCIEGWKIDHETGEGIAGWTISLSNSSGILRNTSTNFTGWYQFCYLEPGQYTVCEENRSGWTNVTPTCIDVDLGLTTEINQNFVNRKLLCINGSTTSNCTGEGLANWTIELRDEAGALIDSKKTDSRGDYSFCSLEPGNYTVCELLQGGWKNVTPLCIPVTLDIENSEDNDFLNDPPICIRGSKINDCIGAGIAGWKIFLYDAVGNRIGDAVTDANGRYSFCNLTQGIYYVCEEEREGWIPVHDESGSIEPSNSTSEPITCNMPWCDDNCVCVNLGCEGAEVDFRNIPQSLCINGSKINNCTGAGIAGWSIYLYDAAGKNIRTVQTDSHGRYSFCGLAPGQYRVCEEERDGYIPVAYINHSSASCLPESCTCDVCNNCIPVILDCKSSEENNFENIPPLSIKGRVIDDCTGLGLKGWTVKLYDDRGAQLTSRTTGADGSYAFTSSSTGGLQLKAGTLYSVCEVVKDGYTPVTYHANNSSPAMSNVYCIPVLLDCGETEVDDFENIPSLIISGHEFNRCTGEGLDGWIIHLKDGAGNILDTTTTDGAGYYEFGGLKPGWYTVCEDSIPEGWTSFRDDPVSPPSPAMALPGTSAAPEDCEKPKCIVVRLDYCEESTDNDFENIPAFCINGTVYNNSTTVANFPIKIENSDGSLVLSILTDAYGEYKFCGLKAGTYTVCVNKPGWTANEPCVIVYLDCMDEEQDFDVYKGRSNILPGIEQPAITLDDTSGAVVEGERSGELSEPTEPDIGGDEEEGRQTQL